MNFTNSTFFLLEQNSSRVVRQRPKMLSPTFAPLHAPECYERADQLSPFYAGHFLIHSNIIIFKAASVFALPFSFVSRPLLYHISSLVFLIYLRIYIRDRYISLKKRSIKFNNNIHSQLHYSVLFSDLKKWNKKEHNTAVFSSNSSL